MNPKGSPSPGLLAASSLVIEAGGDENEAIAAPLHDAGEDQGGETRLADIDERFGARVAGIVRECSDSLTDDKTHNSGVLMSDIQLHGVTYLNNFTASPTQTLWYYSQVLQILIKREVSPRLVANLGENVARMRELIEQKLVSFASLGCACASIRAGLA